jgi:hypothetical protein
MANTSGASRFPMAAAPALMVAVLLVLMVVVRLASPAGAQSVADSRAGVDRSSEWSVDGRRLSSVLVVGL